MTEAFWELGALRGRGQDATRLCGSPQTSPMCQTDRGECDCVCVCVRTCPDLCLGLCMFMGPGAGRAAEGGPLLWLKNLTPPWACRACVRSAKVPEKPAPTQPGPAACPVVLGGREEPPGLRPSGREGWTTLTPTRGRPCSAGPSLLRRFPTQ